jgi:hypothetical protein
MDFSKLKKDISLFLTSEEAKVLKKNVAKLGLTASAIAMIMAQQVREASADIHSDSHNDGTTHGDHTSHTDGAIHTDGHANHTNHADHYDGTTAVHSSTAAAYDSVNRRGGHNSRETLVPIHTDT